MSWIDFHAKALSAAWCCRARAVFASISATLIVSSIRAAEMSVNRYQLTPAAPPRLLRRRKNMPRVHPLTPATGISCIMGPAFTPRPQEADHEEVDQGRESHAGFRRDQRTRADTLRGS